MFWNKNKKDTFTRNELILIYNQINDYKIWTISKLKDISGKEYEGKFLKEYRLYNNEVTKANDILEKIDKVLNK